MPCIFWIWITALAFDPLKRCACRPCVLWNHNFRVSANLFDLELGLDFAIALQEQPTDGLCI